MIMAPQDAPAISDGIDAYHDLLASSADLALESHHRLEELSGSRSLFFGDRALCTVLRPRFLTPAAYHFLQSRGTVILRAFRKAHAAALVSDALLAQFGLTSWERELVRVSSGLRDASPLSRLDAFFSADGRGLSFTEYNAETPAGGAYNDALTEVFYALPVMRVFLRRWDLRPLPARHHVLHALVDAWEQVSGGRNLRRIAIVDWTEVPTRNEFLLFQDYFRRQGIETVIVDPSELEYTAGELRSSHGRIDVVYKRVLLHELVERCGVDNAIIRAVKDHAVAMVNPPACKILHKKASLAVLSDEFNEALFDADEHEAIAASIPWTRVVTERKTRVDGRTVDLLPFIAEQRERMVLKPNDEYGGKGIVLGWEVSDAEWESAIRTALTQPYVVQRRIALPWEPYPSVDDGKLHIIDRMVDTAPYVAHGSYIDGCLTRLGTAALLNVTAGGGSQTPTFIAERR
jgi:glutathionylspermidine synthase